MSRSNTENIAVFAPIAAAIVSIAMAVNPGCEGARGRRFGDQSCVASASDDNQRSGVAAPSGHLRIDPQPFYA
jgi:hypothetical protein